MSDEIDLKSTATINDKGQPVATTELKIAGKKEDKTCDSLREAISKGLDIAKEKNLNPYLTVLKVEETIRDLVVHKFNGTTDHKMMDAILEFLTKVF